MKKIFQAGLLLWFAAAAPAREASAANGSPILHVYEWNGLPAPFTNSQVISQDGFSVLKIENTNDAPVEIELLTITNASVIKKLATVVCDVKYALTRGFEFEYNGDAFENQAVNRLGLICHFTPPVPGGDEITNAHFFALGGTANWKRDTFFPPTAVIANGRLQEKLPTLLELRLRLGKGTIYLRPITLLGAAHSFDWWSSQQAGLIGGIGGTLIGGLGGLIGLLAGLGKARNFVLTSAKICVALGMLSLIAGVVAVTSGQPYAVWYALLLPGFILTLVFSLNLPFIQRRYDELEIRRMTSLDATGR